MHAGCAHSRRLWPHYRQAVHQAAPHLPPGDKALWVASWRSAGAAWTVAFCSGLVPEEAEAQLRAIARYDPPGGTSMDDSLQHMLQLGDFAWEVRNHRLEQLLREPPSAAAQVHQWLTAAEGNCPPPSLAPWQGLRSLPPCREWHSGLPATGGSPSVPGPAGGFLEAPARHPLPTMDHMARLHPCVGGTHSGRGVGARVGPVVRRHARPGDPCAMICRHPARGVGAAHPAEAHHDPRGGP